MKNTLTNNSKRVVITGVGLASPIGIDYEEFSANLFSGTHSFSESSIEDISSLGTPKYVSKIKEEDYQKILRFLKIPDNHVYKKYSSYNTDEYFKREEVLTLWASKKAIEDSKIKISDIEPFLGGFFLGVDSQMDDFYHYLNFLKTQENLDTITDYASFSNLINENLSHFYPRGGISHFADKIVPHLPFHGDIEIIMNGCASSNDCIGSAYRKIQTGQLKYAVCGGIDCPLDPIYYTMFNILNILSEPPCIEESLVPYSLDHTGFILSEGVGMVMLEEYENAINRNAHIYGEVKGYGTNMASFHLTNCDPEGEIYSQCIQKAIYDSGVNIDEIDYINSHGNGSIIDVSETKAIKKVFDSSAYRIPISSTKSIIGHSLVASGALECIAVLSTFENEKIHPTINLKKTRPECDLFYTPNQSISLSVNSAISTSYAFLGFNSCIVLNKI